VSLVFDHVVYAVADLDEAGVRFSDEFGLGSVEGGRHPGFGTANRIVPLGTAYIELIAVIDQEEALATDFGVLIDQQAGAGGGWVGYALRADRLEDHLGEGEPIVDMSRKRPDGTLMEWRLSRLAEMVSEKRWPFLIEWGDDIDGLPGATPAAHATSPTGIRWLEVGGEIAPYASHLDIRRVAGPAGLSRVGIGLDEGVLVI